MIYAILLQIRVIGTLVLRETRMTFGTSHMGYLWAIFQPMVSISFLVFLFYLIGRKSPYGVSLALFFSTAILPLEMYNKLSVSLMRAFTSNKSLLTYPMIKETDTLFARAVLIALTFVIINVIYYGCLWAVGLGQVPAHPELLCLSFLATLALGFGVGSLNAIIYQKSQTWQHIEKLFARPLFFLSGVFYIPSKLPPEAVAVLRWNPIIHTVEMTRESFYVDYESDILNIWYPISLALILIALGLSWERVSRKQRV